MRFKKYPRALCVFVRDFHEQFFILEKGRIVSQGSMVELDEGTVKKQLMV